MGRKNKSNKQHNKPKKKEQKILSILIGPPGSGKTHYAKNNLYNYERVSQDDQGRRCHYFRFLDLLISGVPRIVIDRMNFSKEQRYRYTTPARYLGYKIVYYIFDIEEKLCLERMRSRRDHPTIDRRNINKHKEIYDFFIQNFQSPDDDEAHEINIVKY